MQINSDESTKIAVWVGGKHSNARSKPTFHKLAVAGLPNNPPANVAKFDGDNKVKIPEIDELIIFNIIINDEVTILNIVNFSLLIFGATPRYPKDSPLTIFSSRVIEV